MRYRATLAYDGTAYQGFQRQIGNTPTIQLVLEGAIARICGQQVTVIGSGRTDSGVHASGQVIAFDVEWSHGEEALLRALNANLPDDIALQDIRSFPGFHPRFDAVSRLYGYRVIEAAQRQPLLRHQAWQSRSRLDVGAMQEAARMLLGEHDFGAFGKPPQGENTVRTLYRSEWTVQAAPFGRLLTYSIEANAFLQHMVRRIVWMLVKLGQGYLGLGEFERVFRSGRLDEAGALAPPQGLTLELVRYRD